MKGRVYPSSVTVLVGLIPIYVYIRSLLAYRHTVNHYNYNTWRADKSLALPTSRYRRTESIVSLERGVSLHVPNCNSFHRSLATQKKLVYLVLQYLDHPPYSPDPAPSDYHLFPGLKKKTIERSPFFFRRGDHCCRGDLVGRTTFWTFSEWLAKVRATG